jgi:hypothetical protein
VRHAKPESRLGTGKWFRGETKELIEMKDRVDYDICKYRKLEFTD